MYAFSEAAAMAWRAVNGGRCYPDIGPGRPFTWEACEDVRVLHCCDGGWDRVPNLLLMLTPMQVLAVLICMAIIISKVDVDWGKAFQGYLPSKYIFASGSLYTCEPRFPQSAAWRLSLIQR